MSIKSFSAILVKSILPQIVWIKVDFNHYQYAKLVEDEYGLSYDMSNDNPTYKPKNVLSFPKYSDLELWICEINKQCGRFEHKWKFVDKLKLMAEEINKVFDWYEFLKIPDNQPPDLSDFKSQSVLMYIKQALIKDSDIVKLLKNRSRRFLYFNQLIMDDETIMTLDISVLTNRLLKYIENYEQKWKLILDKHYRKSMYKYDMYDALSLSGRTNVPYVACHKYLLERSTKTDDEHKSDKMREARLRRFIT